MILLVTISNANVIYFKKSMTGAISMDFIDLFSQMRVASGAQHSPLQRPQLREPFLVANENQTTIWRGIPPVTVSGNYSSTLPLHSSAAPTLTNKFTTSLNQNLHRTPKPARQLVRVSERCLLYFNIFWQEYKYILVRMAAIGRSSNCTSSP